MIRRDAFIVPPGARVMLAGLTVTLGPFLTIGLIVVVREIVPLNPLRLVTLSVALPDCPLAKDNDDGLTLRLKSGAAVTVTFPSRMFSGRTPLGLTICTQMLSLLVPLHPPGKRMKDPEVALTTL